MDMTFGPNNELLIASYDPYNGQVNKVFKFTGDFSSAFPNAIVPEPSALLLAAALPLLLSRRRR